MTPEQRTALIRIACRPNTEQVDAAQLARLERAGLVRDVQGFGWYLTKRGVELLAKRNGGIRPHSTGSTPVGSSKEKGGVMP